MNPQHPGGVRRRRRLLSSTACLIEEELAWGCSGDRHLDLVATGWRRRRCCSAAPRRSRSTYLGMLAEEPKLASFCLTEPDAGSDVSGMRTTRRQARATSTCSTARSASSPTAATPTGTRSTPRPTRTPATAASPPSSCPRTTRSSSTSTRTRWASGRPTPRRSPSTTTEVPAGNLLGEENHGFKLAMMTLDRTRPGVAAMATGIARAAFEFATRLLEGARAVRRADRDAPGDPVHDRRHGHEGARCRAWPRGTRRCCSTRAGATRSSPRTPSASPPTPRWRSPPTPCRSTAATASSRTTRSRS